VEDMYLLDWFHWCLILWNNILGTIVSKRSKLNILRPKELLWTVILATKIHAKKTKIEMLKIADVMPISIWDIGILLFLQKSTLRVNSPKNDMFMFFGWINSSMYFNIAFLKNHLWNINIFLLIFRRTWLT